MQYHQGDKIRENELSGACSNHGEIRNAYLLVILIGNPEGRKD
jgi:hypothetical protein